MVAIVGGSRLGLSLGSLSALGQRGVFGSATQGRNGERAYVNVSTGDLVLQDLDAALAGVGPDTSVLRTYNSQGGWGYNIDDGNGWQAAPRKYVRNVGSNTLRRYDFDGASCDYLWDDARQLYVSTVSAGSALDTIRVNADKTYTWTDGATGAQETYDGGGWARITSSTDTSGNTIRYAYDNKGLLTRVTMSDGESIEYTYGGIGKSDLQQVTTRLATGEVLKQVSYTYDNQSRLETVTVNLDPSGTLPAGSDVLSSYTTRYTYDGTSNRVATITQSDKSTLAFTYVRTSDNAYRIATVTDGDGQVTSFGYDLDARTTTVTDPLGASTVYRYDAQGQLTQIRTGVTAVNPSGLSQLSYAYNAIGDVTSITDGLGNTVAMEYDANGNLTRQVDGAGNTLVRTYDARNQVLTETIYAAPSTDGAAPGDPETTRYVYDDGGKNLLRFVVSPDGRVTENRYDAHGLRVSTIRYPASAYDVSALGATDVPSEADVAAWVGAQDLSRSERTDLAYDFRGDLQSVTAYGAVDASGAGVADTASKTTYVYDHRGLLLQTVTPDGQGITQNVYDGLGRVVSTVARSLDGSLSTTTLTQYDDANAKTTVTLANKLTTTSAFDKAGRLLSVIQSSPAGANLGETRYFYDADGRLLMTQDPTGQRTWRLYDAAGRKVADVDAAGGLTEYVYDANNQVTETIGYDTPVDTSMLVDANGVPTTANDASAGSAAVTLGAIRPAGTDEDARSWNLYDAAGRLTWQVDALGYVTRIEYDGASRVSSTTRFATPIDTSKLGNGTGVVLALAGGAAAATATVTVASDAADRIVTRIYDHDGLLRAVIDGEGDLTETRYDAAGQAVETIAYAKKVPGFTDAASIADRVDAARASESLDGLLPASDPDDIASFAYYNSRGQRVAEVDGEGYLTETVYTANGQVERVIRYANKVARPATVTSTLPELRPASDAEDHVLANTWDALGRLSTQTNAEGTVTRYTYDELGHVIQTTAALDTSDQRTVLARYDVQGRVTAELSAVGAALITGGQSAEQIEAIWAQYATTYTYDAAGRRTSSTDANGNRTVFFYDEAGRLRFTVNALGEVAERTYDALGHLTATTRYATRLPEATVSALVGGLLSSSENAAATAALASAKAAAADENSTNALEYDADGRLVTMTDAVGGVSTQAYDAFGDVVRSTQAIEGARTLVGTAAYDRRGLQTSAVSDAGDATHVNAKTEVDYDAFGRVIRSYDANGNPPTQQIFDRLGRVVQVIDPAGVSRYSTYDAFGQVLTQKDALGNVTKYAYDLEARRVTVTTAEDVTMSTVHNREGQTQRVTDGNGNTTAYEYDANGNLRFTRTPVDGTVVTKENTYDAANLLETTIDGNGNVVAYHYDAANRLLTRTVDPDGLKLVTSYQYDAKGQAYRVTDANGVITETHYDLKGEVLTQTVDPDGLALTTTYTYDARGRQLTVQSPGGTVTKYVYDDLGRRIQTIVDPDGLKLTHSYEYDQDGNAVRTAVDLGGGKQQVTHYVYDADGRLTTTVDGEGGVTRTTYDANGNVTERRTYANRIDVSTWKPGTEPAVVGDDQHDLRDRTAYDRMNRAVYTVDGTGAVVEQRYDGNGNVVERIAYAERIPVGTEITEAKVSDAVSAIADVSRDAHIRRVYDALNRLAWSVDGLGDVTRQIYDGAGNLVKQVAYANTLGPTDLPSKVAASNADRVSFRAYDAANRLQYQVDALGGVVEQVYDADGNVVQRIAYGTQLTAPTTTTDAPTADEIATALRDAGAVAGPKRVNRAVFDAAGRAVFGIDASGAVTQNRYDENGNVVATTAYARLIDASALSPIATAKEVQLALSAAAPSPIAVTLADDADGNEAVQASAGDRTTLRAYDAANRLVYAVDPLGYVKQNTYDGAGRVTTTTLYATPTTGLTAGAKAADIEAALRAEALHDQTNSFRYDAVGNLVSSADALWDAKSPTEHVASFTYNGVGDKLTFTNEKGATWTYEYDAAGRLVSETTPEVELTAVTQDADGNLVQGEQVKAGIITRLEYDGLGNLSARTEAAGRPEERTTRYRYDALGRQVETIYPEVGVYDAESAEDLVANGASSVATRHDTTRTLSSKTFYDVFGDAVASTDVAGNTSYKAYDALGRVRYDVDALGYVTGYGRDGFGDVTTLTRYANAPELDATPEKAPTAADIELALEPNDHSDDRTIITEYDAQGRAVRVTQPEVWVYDGAGRSYGAASVVENSYDAFGQLVRSAVLVDKGQTAASDVWAYSTHYFDRRGQETAGVDAMGYVTTRRYDAAGNLVRQTEYAAKATAWSITSLELPPASEDPDIGHDRTVVSTYDLLNRKLSDTRLDIEFSTASDGTSRRGDVTTTYGYDAVGNLTRTTQELGDGTAAITYTYYDALGRTTAVAAPTRSSTVDGSSLTPLTLFARDAYGNVLVKTELAAGAASADETGFTSSAQPSKDRVTLAAYDKYGHVLQTTNAERSSSFVSYDAAGRIAKQWQTVTSDDANEGVADQHTLFTVFEYDALGRQTGILTPASTSVLDARTNRVSIAGQGTVGAVKTTMVYNAFGELVERGSSGTSAPEEKELFDYDAAGRLWRTNSGDGNVKVMLYDLLGRQTATITSAGSAGTGGLGVDLGDRVAIKSAAQVDGMDAAALRRTDSELDLLGRVVKQTLPSRQDPWSASDSLGNGDVPAELGTAYRPSVLQTFDRWGNVLTQSDVRNADWITSFRYNANNQVIEKTQPQVGSVNPDGSPKNVTPTTDIYYDALGRQVALRDANGNVNGQTWDAGGQLVLEIHADHGADGDPDHGIVKHAYDAFGDQVQLTDAMGHVTEYGYDRLGRNTEVTTAPVRVYSVDDQLAVTGGDADQSLTTYKTYDEAGRKVSEENAAHEITRYTYDLRGNVVATRQPLGQLTRSVFDTNGKQIANEDGDGNLTTWRYDAFGLLVAHRDFQIGVDDQDVLHVQPTIGYVTSTFAYDNARQLVSESNDRGSIAGDVSQSKSLAYAYDAAGQLVEITDKTTGKTTQYAYNAAGKHVWEYTSQGPGTEANGSPVVQNQILAYDALGRLAEVSGLDGVDVHFDYDAVGNRLHQSVTYNLQSAKIVPDYDWVNVDTGEVDPDTGDEIYSQEWQQVGSHVDTTTEKQTQQLWFAYDDMNRQTLVDGAVDGNAANLDNVTSAQGHILSYDADGNRVSDTHWGEQVWSYKPPRTGAWYAWSDDTGWTAVSPDDDPSVPRDPGTTQDEAAPNGSGYVWRFDPEPDVQYGDQQGRVTERYQYDGMDRLTAVTTDAFDQSFHDLGADQQVTLENRRYDAASRVVRAGPEGGLAKDWVDRYTKDGASAVTEKTRVSLYDADGRLAKQRTLNADGSTDSDVEYAATKPWSWTTTERVQEHNADGSLKFDDAGNPVWVESTDGTGELAVDADGKPILVEQLDADGNPVLDDEGNPVYVQKRWKTVEISHEADGGYDDAGNVKAYRTTSSGITSYYHYSQLEYDGYREGTVAGYRSDNQGHPGLTTSKYDADGFLVGIDDSTKDANDRTFVNDSSGHVLLKRQVEAQGEDQVVHLLRQLVVDGNVLAVYGAGTDPKKPTNDKGDPLFDDKQGNFDLNYEPITTSYPGPSAGQYTVRGGDTLETIALGAYGDSSQWYVIANANGLRGDQDLRIGQTLVVPSRVGGAHNSADTFKPYDPSKVVGDTTPNLPVPKSSGGGCGALGIILTVIIAVVAVAVTVYTAGVAGPAIAGALTSAGMGATSAAVTGAVVGGAIGGALGSIASQGLSMAVGLQDGFSWRQVGMAALSNAVTAGIGGTPSFGDGVGETLANWAVAGASAAVSNATTQGIAVLTGLQDHFDWRSVATSAVSGTLSAAVGTGVGKALGDVDSIGKFGKSVISGTVNGVAVTTAVTVMNGGHVDMVRIAADAFGNALGSALGNAAVETQQEFLAKRAQREADRESLTLRLDGKAAADFQQPDFKLKLGSTSLFNFDAANPEAVDSEVGASYGSETGAEAAGGSGAVTPDGQPDPQSSVRAGDYGGSLERIARDQLGPGATQREINNYVGQLFELNGISNARTIQPDQEILLPTADTAASTEGLRLYAKDIAVGEELKAAQAAAAAAAAAPQATVGEGYASAPSQYAGIPPEGATIGPDPGWAAHMQGIWKSDLPFLDKVSMSWDTSSYYFRNSERAQGAVQTVGGVTEIAGGVALTDTGAGAVIGVPAIAHGYDTTVTGLTRLFTGEHAETTLYSTLEPVIGSEYARDADTLIPLATGVASLATSMDSAILTSARAGSVAGEDGSNIVYRALTPADAEALNAGEGLTAKAPDGTWSAAQHVANAGPGVGGAAANSPWISTSRLLEVAQSYDSGNGIVAIDLSKVESLQAEVWRTAPRVNGVEGLPFQRSFWGQEVTIYGKIPNEAVIGPVPGR